MLLDLTYGGVLYSTYRALSELLIQIRVADQDRQLVCAAVCDLLEIPMMVMLRIHTEVALLARDYTL